MSKCNFDDLNADADFTPAIRGVLMKCDECKFESNDLRYNKKWKNMICWSCFFDELLYNAKKNLLYADVLDKNPSAYGHAMQKARQLFDKMPLEAPKNLF